MEAIQPAESELREIHEIYIKAWNAQYGAFTLLVSAIETQDYSIVTQANDRLDAARKGMRDYQAALKDYAEKCGIEISYE